MLKVGDAITYIAYGGFSQYPTICTITVNRVTPTQYIMSNGDRYRIKDGHKIGGRWGDSLPQQATDEELAEARAEIRRSKLVHKMSAARWRDLPLDKLEAIAAILAT